jgi:membrane-associated phospholipid phosphatase
VAGINEATFDLVQSVRTPALDLAASFVSAFGNTGLTVAVALGIAVARFRHGRRDAFVPLFIAAVFVIEAAMKLLIAEAPPPEARARGVDVVPFIKSPFDNSFPSGHVARFAFLLGIAPIPAWLIGAGLVAMVITRIYLGEHWFFDTIGGVFLGLGVASVARTVR